jgi:hypothetical protein
MLAVVVVDDDHPQQALDQRKFGSSPSELRHLAAWLLAHGVNQVAMESTAQYWRPVCGTHADVAGSGAGL